MSEKCHKRTFAQAAVSLVPASAGEANWGILALKFEIHPKCAREMHTTAENWSDVKKYVADANEKAIAGIVKYCGIALQKRDPRWSLSPTRRRLRACATIS